MIITICGREFETSEIEYLKIHERTVFITTAEDCYEYRYTKEEDIQEAENYLKFQEITRKELLDAVNIIMITCDFFSLTKKNNVSPALLKRRKDVYSEECQ